MSGRASGATARGGHRATGHRQAQVRYRPFSYGSRPRLPAYVENKAGLTGQTVPGRRIPGHWPYPGPEELAETEPVGPDAWTFLFLLITTPRAR